MTRAAFIAFITVAGCTGIVCYTLGQDVGQRGIDGPAFDRGYKQARDEYSRSLEYERRAGESALRQAHETCDVKLVGKLAELEATLSKAVVITPRGVR